MLEGMNDLEVGGRWLMMEDRWQWVTRDKNWSVGDCEGGIAYQSLQGFVC